MTLTGEIVIDDLEPRIQFEIRLQIALRRNAANIMQHSSSPERFKEYIRERDMKLAKLLGLESLQNVSVVFKGNRIYP